jgi:hypothetical protein
MAETTNTRSRSNKAKGSSYENKVAKELGMWMFNDKNMLSRHLTSGAQKSVYIGDIVPQKRLPDTFNNGIWPFVIECKNGYKNLTPNLNNQNIVRKWLNKSYIEMINNEFTFQKVIYLITSFHGYSPLLFTDIMFSPFVVTADLIINVKIDDTSLVIPFYIYKYRELLEIEFSKVYENNQDLIDRLSK